MHYNEMFQKMCALRHTATDHKDATACCRPHRLQACLSSISQQRHHWSEQPRVAFHGHALAAGQGRQLHMCTATASNLLQLQHLVTNTRIQSATCGTSLG
jgi:hypothetical protein